MESHGFMWIQYLTISSSSFPALFSRFFPHLFFSASVSNCSILSPFVLTLIYLLYLLYLYAYLCSYKKANTKPGISVPVNIGICVLKSEIFMDANTPVSGVLTSEINQHRGLSHFFHKNTKNDRTHLKKNMQSMMST